MSQSNHSVENDLKLGHERCIRNSIKKIAVPAFYKIIITGYDVLDIGYGALCINGNISCLYHAGKLISTLTLLQSNLRASAILSHTALLLYYLKEV